MGEQPERQLHLPLVRDRRGGRRRDVRQPLVVAESRVSDKQKRTMLLLSVCDTAFVICFLIELWYTRRVLFYVEVSVLTCAALSSAAVWKPTTGLGGPDQTREFSSSVKSKSIRLTFGRIDRSRRVLEAQPKSLCQNIRIRSH